MASVTPQALAPLKRVSTRRLWRRDRLLLALGLPGAIALILFQYVPILGNIIAFQHSGIRSLEFT